MKGNNYVVLKRAHVDSLVGFLHDLAEMLNVIGYQEAMGRSVADAPTARESAVVTQLNGIEHHLRGLEVAVEASSDKPTIYLP